MQPAFKSAIRSTGESMAVDLPGSLRRALEPGSELAGFAHGGEAVVLLKGASQAQGYLAGTIPSLSIGEVLGHLVAAMKTGKLTVSSGPHRKTVYFRDGQIVFAASTELHERLGQLLVRLKMITAGLLEEALGQVGPGKKIGQVLIASGRISAGDLYSAMTFLVREISIGLFELTEGGFFFLEGPFQSENTLKLPERTRAVLVEGMKRGEEVERLRRRLPGTLRVKRGPKPPTPGAEDLVLSVSAGTDLAQLRASYEGSEHAFLGEVDELLRSAALLALPAEIPPRRAAAIESKSPVELYAALIKTICGALRSSGKDLKELQSFFSDPLPGMEEAFAGVSLTDDGQLDFDRVMANVSGASSAMRRAKAYEALDGFLSYAFFSAKNAMSPELAESLSSELRRIQRELP